jgi:hypothetical protein
MPTPNQNKKISQLDINGNPHGSNLIPMEADGVTLAIPLSGISSFVSLSGNINTVVSKNISYSVSPSETTTCFTNEGAASGITFMLPAAVKNLNYTFFMQNSNQMTVQAQSGNTIRIGLDVTSSGGTISGFDTGSSIKLVAINASEWVCLSLPTGSWLI